jgi:hypothetical protein
MRKLDPDRKFGIEELLGSLLLAFAATWFSFGLITFMTWAFDTERLHDLPGNQTHAKSVIPERTGPSKSR